MNKRNGNTDQSKWFYVVARCRCLHVWPRSHLRYPATESRCLRASTLLPTTPTTTEVKKKLRLCRNYYVRPSQQSSHVKNNYEPAKWETKARKEGLMYLFRSVIECDVCQKRCSRHRLYFTTLHTCTLARLVRSSMYLHVCAPVARCVALPHRIHATDATLQWPLC